MTVPELAAFLRISEKSVYALISGKRITHIRVLSCVRFLKADVLRYMKENRVSASDNTLTRDALQMTFIPAADAAAAMARSLIELKVV
jgi:excisionase family DNA binding protein